MRYIAKVNNTPDVIRVMIHSDSDGSALLYIFDSPFDGACTADYWFASVDDAAECAAEDYGVKASDWFDVPDPQAHCQGDWVTPAKIPGRELNAPEWGQLQLWLDGQWRELDMTVPSTVEIDYNQLTPSARFAPNAG